MADLLRGDYKLADYGKIILPLIVLRRLDSLLESKKQKVLDAFLIQYLFLFIAPILLYATKALVPRAPRPTFCHHLS